MRRDLERRLLGVEARCYGSPRVAAILRRIETISAQEFVQQLGKPTGIFDLATLSDSELERLIDKLGGMVAGDTEMR